MTAPTSPKVKEAIEAKLMLAVVLKPAGWPGCV